MMMSTEVEQVNKKEFIESIKKGEVESKQIIEIADIVITKTQSLRRRKELTGPQSFFLQHRMKDVEELVSLKEKLLKNPRAHDTAVAIVEKLFTLKTVLEMMMEDNSNKKEEVKKSNSLKADLEKIMDEISPQVKEEAINNQKINSQPFSLKEKLKSLFFCCWGKKESEGNNSETMQLLRK